MTSKMHPCRRFVLVLLVVVGSFSPERAHAAAPRIERVEVGLPGFFRNQATRCARRGAWAPVYVHLKGANDGNAGNQYQLSLEASDKEETPYRYTVPIPAMAADQETTVISYFRPVQFGNEVTLTVIGTDGSKQEAFKHAIQDTASAIVGAGALLFVSVGSRLDGLNQALLPEKKGNEEEQFDEDDRGARRFGYLETVESMPDFWIGYDSIDVLVMTTSRPDFVDALSKNETKRRALLEWVRRGGKLVVSVGSNHQAVAALLEKMPGLIDVTVKGSSQRKGIHELSSWTGGDQITDTIELADLEAGPNATVLIREEVTRDDKAIRPLLVQGACGMGRVLLFAFDLDQAPFTKWSAQKQLWEKLQKELTPNVKPRAHGENVGVDEETSRTRRELLSEMQRGLESFPEIPVISFGWVALFIFLYILLVGPIDYFILKKLFKRLELTWITFPVTVLLISVTAYFAAYYVKGDDLRINKIDLVDIDLHNQQAYGQTWWTVFSPRITTYTLDIQPSPEWVSKPKDVGLKTHSTVVSLLSSPERETRLGAQSLFPQPYAYAPYASGIENVPIPVWSTRTFSAFWRAPLDQKKPAIEADLDYSRAERESTPRGKITSHLPVALEGVALFYREKWYNLGTLAPGETRRVETFFEAAAGGRARPQWFRDNPMQPDAPGEFGDAEAMAAPEGEFSHEWLIHLMFFSESKSDFWLNSGVRGFDQAWRIRPQRQIPPTATTNYRDEIILVGRTAKRTGDAATINNEGISSSRLWMGALVGNAEQKSNLRGFLAQETYVRIFIPIRRN